MSYYTNFKLTAGEFHGDGETLRPIPMATLERLGTEIEKMNVFECDSDLSMDDLDYGVCGNSKWYDYEADMCLLSKRFPGILFHLYGEGEVHDDIWDAYFLDGKMQFGHCEIVHEEFSPTKLTLLDVEIDEVNGTYCYQD